MPLLNLLVSCAIWHHICSRSFRSWGRGSNLFVQHIPQMLNWIVICGIWRPGQHIELFKMFLKPFLNNVWQSALFCWKRPHSPGKTVVMKGCTKHTWFNSSH